MRSKWKIFFQLLFAPWPIAVSAQEHLCPKNLKEWEAWRSARAADVVSILSSDADQKRKRFFIDEMKASKKCSPELRPLIDACTARLYEFEKQEFAEELLSDEEKKQAEKKFLDDAVAWTQLPPELLDESFLRNAIHSGSLKEAQAAVEKVNQARGLKGDRQWIALPYHSTLNRNGSDGVFQIYIPADPNDPDPKYRTNDRWFRFGVDVMAVSDRSEDYVSVDVISLRRSPENRTELRAIMYDVKGLKRQFGLNQISVHPELSLMGDHPTNSKFCLTCHQGVNRIAPDAVLYNSEDESLIERMNEGIFAAQQADSFPGGFDPRAYGPPLGPSLTGKPELAGLRDAVLKECLKNVPSSGVRQEKIRSAMSCQRCHSDGGMRKPLTGLHLKWGVRHFVEKAKLMPKGADSDLNSEERSALVNCLSQEYFGGAGGKPGLLQRWLSEVSCSPESWLPAKVPMPGPKSSECK